MMTPTGYTFETSEILNPAVLQQMAKRITSTVAHASVDQLDDLKEHLKLYSVVTKLLQRKEWDEKAYAAIRAEADGLLKSGTWLENTVIEKEKLIADTKKRGEKIHIGDLLTLCSIKYAELDKEFRCRGRDGPAACS